MPLPASPSRRIPSLDGLRALSISFVVAFHLIGGAALWGRANGLGNLGVRVFFVISGYLITRLLLDELDFRGSINLPRFYLRRSLRIFPPFYSFLLIVALSDAAGLLELRPFDLLRASTYTINYFPGATQSVWVRHIWSLCVEEQFYLLWPAVLCFAGRKSGMRAAMAAVVLIPLIRMAYWIAMPAVHPEMDRRFETVADALAMGCLLAGFRPWIAARPWYRRIVDSPLFLALPPLIVAVALFGPDRPRLYFLILETLLNAAIAIVIDRYVRNPGAPGGRLLNWGPAVWIGQISYYLYLWQQPFIDRTESYFAHPWPWGAAAMAAFTLASYFLTERLTARLRIALKLSHAPAKLK